MLETLLAMRIHLPSLLASAELGPIEIRKARLSRGSSLFVIGLFSALCWAVLISTVWLVWNVL